MQYSGIGPKDLCAKHKAGTPTGSKEWGLDWVCSECAEQQCHRLDPEYAVIDWQLTGLANGRGVPRPVTIRQICM